MTGLLFRLAIYVPVLFLIAVVVVGQRHETARGTIQEAVGRVGRWLAYTGILVLVALLITWIFID